MVTGRVTDASWWSARPSRTSAGRPTSHDALAGAVVAGHVIECGTQATGGNFSGFRSPSSAPAAARLPARGDRRRRLVRDHQARRHRRRGHGRHGDRAAGLRDPGHRYLGPDVTVHLDTSIARRRRPTGSGSRESAARRRRARLKVCVNELGGFRNSVEFVLIGLDIEAKADWVRGRSSRARDPSAGRGDVVLARHRPTRRLQPRRAPRPAALHGPGPSPEVVGKAFTAPLVELALGVLPRLHPDRPAGAGHAVRRLPRRLRRPRGRRTPSCTPTGAASPSCGPAGRHRRARARRRPGRRSPYPRSARPPTRAGCRSARRPRAVRRQGRRRQPRSVGRATARRSTTSGSPGCQARSRTRAHPRAGARGRGPRRRGATRCPTWAASTS